MYLSTHLANTQSMLITNVDEKNGISVYTAIKLYLRARINRVS